MPDPKKISVVQFIHPRGDDKEIKRLEKPVVIDGEEYPSIRHWKQSNEEHGRKFLVNSGEFVTNDASAKCVSKKNLHFWGEAEWTTLCRKIGKNENLLPEYEYRFQGMPAYLNVPTQKPLNTDPYVFGDNFMYCCCRQFSQGNPTPLHDLQDGSIILFGSQTWSGSKLVRFFVDTVFVIEKKVCNYDGSTDLSKIRGISEMYKTRVLSTIVEGQKSKISVTDENCLGGMSQGKKKSDCLPPGGRYTLYRGQTFNSKKKLMQPFSFVPILSDENYYARPYLDSLKDGNNNELISNKKIRKYHLSEVDPAQVPVIWSNLLKALKGYDLAYHFDE